MPMTCHRIVTGWRVGDEIVNDGTAERANGDILACIVWNRMICYEIVASWLCRFGHRW